MNYPTAIVIAATLIAGAIAITGAVAQTKPAQTNRIPRVEICKVEPCVYLKQAWFKLYKPSPIRFRDGDPFCAAGYRLQQVRPDLI